jgi:hypothetical protein
VSEKTIDYTVFLVGLPSKYSAVRTVKLPADEGRHYTTYGILEAVFERGQIDRYPDPEHRSVSVGDVILLTDGRLFRVEGRGFATVSPFFLTQPEMANVGGALISWADSNLDKPADEGDAPGYEKQQRDVEDLNEKIRSTLKGLRGEFD